MQGLTQSSAAVLPRSEPRVLHVTPRRKSHRWNTWELHRKVLSACPGHGQPIFLQSCRFLIFYIFLKKEKADIHPVFASTSIRRPMVPYHVICNKMFLQVCKKYHIVLPLEPLRLSLGTQREPSFFRAFVQCHTVLFSPLCRTPETQLWGDSREKYILTFSVAHDTVLPYSPHTDLLHALLSYHAEANFQSINTAVTLYCCFPSPYHFH